MKNKQYSLLFADDLILFCYFKKGKINVEKAVNRYLKDLEIWSAKWRMTFAPHKCSYSVFSRAKRNRSDQNFNLALYGEQLNHDNNPKFLGITFDEYLSGKDHIARLKTACNKRLNVLKILSHKSWGIGQTTLVNIYKSLVLSIIEYFGYMACTVSITNMETLQGIQNAALRMIFDKRKECDIQDLHTKANIKPVKIRLQELTGRYLEGALASSNPLIEDLTEDYKEICENYVLGNTILCNYNNIL
jgi:hypothetical protein